jgi:hypothetical protein
VAANLSSTDTRVGAIASRQLGLVSIQQLLGAGLTYKMVRGRLARGSLVRVRRGVFRCAGAPITWEMTVLAAVLAAGPGALASHTTAACLWGLEDRHRAVPSPGIHISGGCQCRLAGVTHHRMPLAPRDRSLREFVPVTSPARTLLDVSGSMGPERVGVVVDDGLRRGLLSLKDVRAVLVHAGGWGGRGARSLRDALAIREGDYQPGSNEWEKAMDEWWDAAGLPEAERQYRIRINGRLWIVDRAIVEARVAVEWNGFASHGTRSGFDHDALKAAALVSAGWIHIPVTTRTPAEEVCRAVLGAVAQRLPGSAGWATRGGGSARRLVRTAASPPSLT